MKDGEAPEELWIVRILKRLADFPVGSSSKESGLAMCRIQETWV